MRRCKCPASTQDRHVSSANIPRLYDNAQLLSLYLDAWLITAKPLFLDMVHDIAAYLTSDPIQSPHGGFHASEDADSAPSATETEHKEGAFYVWDYTTFNAAVADERIASICAKYWNVREDGNVSPKHDIQGELRGQNTLGVSVSIATISKTFSITEDEALDAIAKGRERLLKWRNKNRPRPHLDDKILVSWNGLAISALARTAASLSALDAKTSARYLDAAASAAAFIKRELYSSEDHTLKRVYREGAGDTQGFADDYAFLITGLIDLYEATFDDSYLLWADQLQQTQIDLFLDPVRGGFFGTAAGQPDVLIRSKDAMDNAEPSANGSAARNLFRLGGLLGDDKYENLAKETVRAFEVEMGQHPGLFTGLMSGIVCARLGIRPIVISGAEGSAEVDEALNVLRGLVRPGSTVVRVGGSTKSEWLRSRNELVGSIPVDKEMVQFCEEGTCKLVKASELKDLLKASHL